MAWKKFTKYGGTNGRALRSVALLQEITRLRLAKPRDRTALERAECKLFELDLAHGYDRVR